MSSPVVLPAQNLPFSNFVQVNVTIQPNGAVQPSFNKGLFVTDNVPVVSPNPIPPQGPNSRVRGYTSVAAMIADGFAQSSFAVQGASMYFSQTPPPQKIYIGVAIDDAVTQAGIVSADIGGDGAGSGYNIGDMVQVPGGTTGKLAVLRITDITTNGSVDGIPTAYSIVEGGEGYHVTTAIALTTLSGTGSGATIDLQSVGETIAETMDACRAANSDWYGFVYMRLISSTPDTDQLDAAAWAQSAQPPCVLFAQSSSAGVPANTPGNLFALLKAANYNRVFPIFSTTQNAAYPNNLFAAVGAMGVAMGRNTGAAASYFTMMFKSIAGIVPEPLQQYEVDNICGSADGSTVGLNGNVLVQYPNVPMMQRGNVSNGQFFDQILQIDMLASDLQISCVDELVDDAALNQTDSAQSRLLNRCNGACDRSVSRGFIGPGQWKGTPILNQLKTGDTLANGYKCMSDTYNNQAQADRVARKGMPIYVALIQAGVVQSVLIAVSVQQ